MLCKVALFPLRAKSASTCSRTLRRADPCIPRAYGPYFACNLHAIYIEITVFLGRQYGLKLHAVVGHCIDQGQDLTSKQVEDRNAQCCSSCLSPRLQTGGGGLDFVYLCEMYLTVLKQKKTATTLTTDSKYTPAHTPLPLP